MRQRKKIVYRDIATNRLITRQEAESRDSSSWIKEEVVVDGHGTFGRSEHPATVTTIRRRASCPVS